MSPIKEALFYTTARKYVYFFIEENCVNTTIKIILFHNLLTNYNKKYQKITNYMYLQRTSK